MRHRALVPVLLLAAFGCGHDAATVPDTTFEGIPGSAAQPDVWYASPDASADGNGSLHNPWRLDTALAGGRRVAGVRPVGAGDTIYVRGGTYIGRFNVTVGGESGTRIVIAGYPGEHAILDGNDGDGSSATVLAVQLPWVEIRDLEVMHGNPVRTAALPNLVSNYGSHNRFANLVLHDGGVGLFNEHDATDVTITGCIVYHNGWLENNEGHGHGLYLKSDAGPVVARGNAIFDNFGFGIHAYSERLSSGIDSVVLEDNVVFNNSAVHGGHLSANILLGGIEGLGNVTRSAVVGNLAYYADGIPTSNVKIGYDTTHNVSARVAGNMVVGGNVILDVHRWAAAVITGDTIVGLLGDSNRVVQLTEPGVTAFAWSHNAFANVDPASPRWRFLGTSYDFAGWVAQTGFSGDSLVDDAQWPARVRISSYEPGRAIISLYRAGNIAQFTLPDGVLAPGDSFTLCDVQRLDLPPGAAGRYHGGTQNLTLVRATPVPPKNWNEAGPGTGDVLHVYLLERR